MEDLSSTSTLIGSGSSWGHGLEAGACSVAILVVALIVGVVVVIFILGVDADEILQLELQSWGEGVVGRMGPGGGLLIAGLGCWPLTFVICG